MALNSSNSATYETGLWQTIKEFLPGILKTLSVIGVVVLIFQTVTLFTSSSSPSWTFESDYVRDHNIRVGSQTSGIKVIYFFDLQCPACKQNDTNIETVQNNLQDRVEFVYRNFTLSSIHPYAKISANAAQAVARQDKAKYFEFKKEIFAVQNDLSPNKINEVTKKININYEQWDRARNSREIVNEVELDVKDAESLNNLPKSSVNGETRATGTPTTLIVKDSTVLDWWGGVRAPADQEASIKKFL
jgi:hypothetical protein